MPDTGATTGPKLVTELKVTGHLMTLDTGLYCVFPAPAPNLPDRGNGLPGVRLTLPPGHPAGSDAIEISSFAADGWLGSRLDAALVRIRRGPGQILVTVYQTPEGTEAPRLQVLRLTEPGTPAAAGQAAALPGAAAQPQVQLQPLPQHTLPPQALAQQAMAQQALAQQALAQQPPAAARPVPPAAANPQAPDPARAEVSAHIQRMGDVLGRLGEWIGERGSQRWIEGFGIRPHDVISPEEIEYQAVLGRGWLSPWSEGGQFCGSRGMALPVLGLRVRLKGKAAETHECEVSASFVDGSKVGPITTGEACEAESLAPLEAFRIVLRPRVAGPQEPDEGEPEHELVGAGAPEPAKGSRGRSARSAGKRAR